MKGTYVLVMVLLSMGTIWGMAPQNTNVGGSPYSYDLWDSQVHSHDAHQEHRTARQLLVGWAISDIVGAIGGLIAGGTLATNFAYKEYSRNFAMIVENRLPWKLQVGRAIPKHGVIHSFTDIIDPGEDGLVTGHKRNFAALGTEGIVSWRIKERGWTIIVFWKVPYAHCSGMALGIYTDLPEAEPNQGTRKSYISDLTSDGFTSDSLTTISKTIARRDFCTTVSRICTTNNDIKVCGIMSTDDDSNIKVRIEQA